MFWFQIVTGCASILSLVFSIKALRGVYKNNLQIGNLISQKVKGDGNVQVGGDLNG